MGQRASILWRLLKWLATIAINWDTGWHSALGIQEPQGQASSLPSWWFNMSEAACSSQPTCLTRFVSAQIIKLQCAVPVQQGFLNLHPTTENITHPYMKTVIRNLWLDTSKMGRPNASCHPSSAGGSQRDLNTPIPKELHLPSLEGGMLGS